MANKHSSRSLASLNRNGLQQAAALDRDGLLWLEAFRWLRARELALLLWPANDQRDYAIKSAEALFLKWYQSGWVIIRNLPVREAGRARSYVLSEDGAQALSKMVARRPIRSGEKWGTEHLDEVTGESTWCPPGTWQHELLQSSLLALLRAKWWPEARVVPERTLRRYGMSKDHVPDGLVCMPLENGRRVWLWLELERARKTGAYMNAMADKLIAVATQPDGVEVCEMPSGERLIATAPALACVVGQHDDRDHAIHHGSRVHSAIQRRARRNLRVMLFGITTDVFGTTVEDVEFGWVDFRVDPLAHGIAKLEWHEEAGVRIAPWGQMELAIWKRTEPGDPWGWSVALRPLDRHHRRSAEPEEVAVGTAVSSKAATRAAYGAAQAQPLRFHPATS